MARSSLYSSSSGIEYRFSNASKLLNSFGSRKFIKLRISRMVLLRGVPVRRTLWTELSSFSFLNMRLLPAFTVDRVCRQRNPNSSWAKTHVSVPHCETKEPNQRRQPQSSRSTHSTIRVSHLGILANTPKSFDDVMHS